MRDPVTRRALVWLVLAASLTGCAATPALPPGTDLVRTELIFGRARPDGSTVTEAQWRAFVDEHLAPRFAGFTVYPVTGQYRNQAGQLAREDSYLVLLLHEPDAKSQAAIEEIRAIYKRLFDQESVPRVSVPARVSF